MVYTIHRQCVEEDERTQIEAIMEKMDSEKQAVLADYMNRTDDRQADVARKAYVCGLLEGVKIAGVIWLEALRGQFEWDKTGSLIVTVADIVRKCRSELLVVFDQIVPMDCSETE